MLLKDHVCPDCSGTTFEHCSNPDHGIPRSDYSAGSYRCPGCEYNQDRRVPRAVPGTCQVCDGEGFVTREESIDFCNAFDIDFEEHNEDLNYQFMYNYFRHT